MCKTISIKINSLLLLVCLLLRPFTHILIYLFLLPIEMGFFLISVEPAPGEKKAWTSSPPASAVLPRAPLALINPKSHLHSILCLTLWSRVFLRNGHLIQNPHSLPQSSVITAPLISCIPICQTKVSVSLLPLNTPNFLFKSSDGFHQEYSMGTKLPSCKAAAGKIHWQSSQWLQTWLYENREEGHLEEG